MSADFDCDVVVCGYGLAGQAATSLLAQRGHDVVAFERWPSLYGLPRLCTLDGEAVRIVQAAGDIDRAFRDSHPATRYFLVSEDHEVLIDIDQSGQHASGHPSHTSMYQPDVEDAMDRRARASGAKVHLGREVLGVEQDATGVTVRVAANQQDGDTSDRRVQEVRAKYVIGADGDRSSVRESLEIPREAWPFHHAWISIDALRRRRLPDMFGGLSPDLRIPVVVCAPNNRTHATVPIGATRLRFELLASSPDAAHDENLDEATAYRKLEEYWGLTRDDVEIYRRVVFPFKGRLAERWQVGRVFLVGDAAHVMTPFFGQGGCSALRDAITLAWKFDLVLRGISDTNLLDTYEPERQPHVRDMINASDVLAAQACEPDPELARLRNERLRNGEGAARPKKPTLRDGVLLRSSAGTIEWPVGDQGPQGRIRMGDREGRFDDLFSWGFQLIVRDRSPEDLLTISTRNTFESIGGILAGVSPDDTLGLVTELDGNYSRFLEEHDAIGVLLRPDFYIFSLIKRAVDAERVLRELFGQLRVFPSPPAPTAEATDFPAVP